MTYAETLEYLYTRLPMFSRTGAAALKPGLENIIRLCEALGNPQHKFKSVHIAGTNGKGSTSHMLAAIFQKCGYKTGLYTSPHLIDFRERIRVDGQMISESFVVDFVANYRSVIEDISPSFFEITVAMAFAVFAEEKVDIAIIETGLGGRLDSTNIIIPELSIITNISLDHTDLLGDTREKIAAEKAGIIKQGAPVIVGEKDVDTAYVFLKKAAQMDAPLYFAEDNWRAKSMVVSNSYQQFLIDTVRTDRYFGLSTDLIGNYQAQNIQTVLSAHERLVMLGWDLPPEKTLEALQEVAALTGLQGRYQHLSHHPTIVADVAHNTAGLQHVLSQWHQEKVAKGHIILGFVKDKDVSAALKLFPADAQYYFTNADIPRALPAKELKGLANEAGLTGEAFSTVKDAVHAAKQSALSTDGILITGSFFIVGEAMIALSDTAILPPPTPAGGGASRK